ncbi:MAG: hypothetical protein KTR24_12470 [Saprospiraceae bacterium]|nr:hypothetical protein [Saprospiraceae bacterium]
MALKKIILGLILMGSSLLALAQSIEVETGGADFDGAIDGDTRAELVSLLEAALHRYNNYATLIDRDLREVSVHSEKIFQGLFTLNAAVLDDLSRQEQVLSVEEYIAPIAAAHPRGIRFDLENATLREVTIDASGNYRALVDVEKHLYQGIDQDGLGFECELGRRYKLAIEYRLPSNQLDRAFIHQIDGNITYDGCIRQQLTQPKLQLFGGMDLDIDGLQIGQNTVRNEAAASGVNWGVQARYLLSEGLGVHAGIFYGSRKLDLRVNEAAFDLGGANIDSDGDNYFQSVNLNTANDQTSLTQIEIPIGVTLSTYSGGKSYGIEVSAVPTFISVDPIQNRSLAQFDVAYEDLQLYLSGREIAELIENPALLDGLPFGVVDGGNRVLNLDESFSSTAIKLRVAPYMTLQVNRNISLELGIYYKLSFMNLYENTAPITGDLLPESFQDFSVTRDVVETIGLNSYGARIGINLGF